MKKYIYLLTTIVLFTLTGCYDNDPVYDSMWVANMKTLPLEENENTITLTGETKMGNGCLYFLLSKDEDFSDYQRVSASGYYEEKKKTATINKWNYIGTWYYKLVAMYGDEIYDVSNVETFTVENPLTILEPTNITWSSATLNAISKISTINGKKVESYFYITGPSLERAITATNHYVATDEGYLYSVDIPSNIRLQDYTKYNVAFYQDLDGARVESEPMEFRTGQRVATPLQISAISGNTYDIKGNSVKLTEDLNVVVYNYKTGYVTKEPLVAVYNESKNNYEFKEGSSYNLDVDQDYAVAIFKNKGTSWRITENSLSEIWYGDAYAEGVNQDPIYFGTCEKLNIDNPYIKANLNVKTAQVRVRYPATWGESKLTLIDSQKQLPSFSYGLDAYYMYGPTIYTSEYQGNNCGLTADGKYYEYMYNIWPVNLNPKTHTIRIQTPLKTETIALPTSVNLKANEIYTVTIYATSDMTVDQITVTKWDNVENGGEIVIN